MRLESSRPPGSEGILHAVGVMMGKDRRTDRKTRKTLVLSFFFLTEGWRRVEEFGRGLGSGGGGAGGTVVERLEEEEEDVADDGRCCSLDTAFVGSPINGVGDPGMGECHERMGEREGEERVRERDRDQREGRVRLSSLLSDLWHRLVS